WNPRRDRGHRSRAAGRTKRDSPSRSRRGGRAMTATPMRRPFDSWRATREQLRSAPAIALFLDFDGTITSIRRSPDEVRLYARMKRAIERLAVHPRVRVWMISSRRLADLRDRVRLRRVHYVGLHGWEEDGRLRVLAAETRRAVEKIKNNLAASLD